MESIKRWGCCSAKEIEIGDALAFLDEVDPATEDGITELLANVERTLEQKDGDVPMSAEVQIYASHLEKHLDKVTVGVQISRDTLTALGTLHWVGAGLTIVAMALNTSLRMHDNKEECSYIMKQCLDIWKRFMKPILENEGLATDIMAESMHLVIEGYLFCRKISNSRTLKRFICVSIHEREIAELKKKLEFFLLKEIAVNTIPLRGPSRPTTSRTFATKLVGLEERKRDVLKLLKLEEKEETRVVVLHGMGGVGKSILAKFIYKEVSVSRERRHCQIELGEKPSKDHITNLQRQMVENLTGQSLMMERDPEVISDKLRRVLLSKTGEPVLIYIDNVLQPKDLEELISLDCELITLPKGSRLLVTTRDESVCTKVFNRNWGVKVEKFSVRPLNNIDAQKLFFLHAFGQEEPSSDVVDKYDDGQGLISKMVISICGNLPLALRVLGRSLFATNVHAWRKKYDDLKNHEELELEEELVTNVLKSSYDVLNGETQTAFLMACVCFYNYGYVGFKEVVESILPRAKTSKLIDLGLLERQPSPDSQHGGVSLYVKMHDLVRDLGYQMAVARKCAPTKMPTCKQDLLDDDHDESWSEVKWLRVPALEDGIEAEFVEKCRELEVIVLDTHVNGHIANPPLHLKVVIISTTSSLSLELAKLKEVVYLSVDADPYIQEFPVGAAPSTRRLQVLRGFSGASIPKKAIDFHKNTLRKLGCIRIAELSSYFCHAMTKLQLLDLDSFEGESFPEEMGSLASLERLIVSSTTIQELPQSLGNLRRLQNLDLRSQNLKEIPSGVLGGMKELAGLQLHLQRVTCMPMQDFGQLASLETLVLVLPCVNRLTGHDGVVLSFKLEKLKFFSLELIGCESLEGVQLTCPSLECMILQIGKLEVLPPKFITGSTNLRNLALTGCNSLQGLSAETEILWALETLAVRECPALKAIAEGLMRSVEGLALVECPGLKELPGDVDEEKARCMHFLACDTHLLPPQFLGLPGVVDYSQGDWRAQQQLDSFFYESFDPIICFHL